MPTADRRNWRATRENAARPSNPYVNVRNGRPRSRTVDPFGGLTGEDRDIALAVTNLFESYGLGSLAPKVVEYVQQGYSGDTISILLQQTNEYKQRFSANEARKRRGLPVLSPREYLAVESSYREIMASAGLPVGFYDSTDDFTKWLEQDVSPTEVKQRVDAAASVVNAADPDTLSFFRQHYSTGDLIAYALDSKRAAPLIEKRFAAARIGGAAAGQGVGVSSEYAELLAGRGVSGQQAQAGFGFVAAETAATQKLASIEGVQFSQDDLMAEAFGDNAQAGEKRKKLSSAERGRFSGSSGQSKTSLSTNGSGSA